MENTNQFLGTERVGKLMRRYAVPCIISLLVGALYNIVDQIFIANASYLGSYGNAANTVVFPLTVVALAIAVIEQARSQGAKIAATTHYAELKTFAMTTAGVENASCEFDVETLCPTYKLLIGIPGKSNAFAISKRLGLSEAVIEKAKAQMDSESIHFEDVLTQLEQKRQQLEKEKAEVDRLYAQREEDARKAREFRTQMERAKENAPFG